MPRSLRPHFANHAALLMSMMTIPAVSARGNVATVFEPVRVKSHQQRVRTDHETYTIDVGGRVDMDNTTTRSYETFAIAFQNNISLTVANTGDCTVQNPRVITNDRRRWWTMDDLLREILKDAKDDQEKLFLIYDFVRKHRHHDDPIFGGDELHDPVAMLNVFGAGLCDDSGYVGCSLLYHAGLNKHRFGKDPFVRALHGHMMCEAYLPSGYQFLDIDQNTFYLDLENERPVSGDAIVRDHHLAKREHAYGPIFRGWQVGERAASLFGRDDGTSFRAVAGHRIEMELRPGERIEYRWDNCGKFASDDSRGIQNRRFWGNSLWIYEPVLTPERIEKDATRHTGEGLIYRIETPYAVCGGRVHACWDRENNAGPCTVSISFDGQKWKDVWSRSGAGGNDCRVEIDEALQTKQAPAKYAYFVRLSSRPEAIKSLRLETDLMTSPHSLPRLAVGRNHVEYTDQTPRPHEITITHRWRESDAVMPPAPPMRPIAPVDGQPVRATTVPFSWPADAGSPSYHIQISRREDMRLAYRAWFDVVINTNQHHAPFAGLFSPDQPYYWRVRPRNRHGVWGPWSPVWQFTWQGPRIPVDLKHDIHDGQITISWQPNPRGERPARYEVYGSDERGFTPSKTLHEVEGLGTQPGNLLCETVQTQCSVVSAEVHDVAANRSFFRVVAVDRNGIASGPSELLELPHPFIYSDPAATASVGNPYRYQVKTLRSLGDLQFRYAAPNKAYWEKEGYEFRLVEGPAWLQMDKQKGMLTGTPGEADKGEQRVTIVCIRRFPHELKRSDYRNSYFLKEDDRFQSEHRQSYQLTVR